MFQKQKLISAIILIAVSAIFASLSVANRAEASESANGPQILQRATPLSDPRCASDSELPTLWKRQFKQLQSKPRLRQSQSKPRLKQSPPSV